MNPLRLPLFIAFGAVAAVVVSAVLAGYWQVLGGNAQAISTLRGGLYLIVCCGMVVGGIVGFCAFAIEAAWEWLRRVWPYHLRRPARRGQ